MARGGTVGCGADPAPRPAADCSRALGVRILTPVPAVTSTRAALYYPFVRILDPVAPPDLPREINLPPSGFITGIYARNDIEHHGQS